MQNPQSPAGNHHPRPTHGSNHAPQPKTLNISDQSETTWRWSSRDQTQLSVQQPPAVEYVPANQQSFAPPANLSQLQYVPRPATDQYYSAGDIYKSPIDQPLPNQSYDRVESLSATSESKSQDSSVQFSIPDHLSNQAQMELSLRALEVPKRDENTEAKEFVSRGVTDRPLFNSSTVDIQSDSHRIVLRSQPPEELAKSKTHNLPAPKPVSLPPAQLLTPDFEAYVGSPMLDSHSPAYQENTQWQVYTPTPAAPPSAIFQSSSLSQPRFSAEPHTDQANELFSPSTTSDGWKSSTVEIDMAPPAVAAAPPANAPHQHYEKETTREMANQTAEQPELPPIAPVARFETDRFGSAPMLKSATGVDSAHRSADSDAHDIFRIASSQIHQSTSAPSAPSTLSTRPLESPSFRRSSVLDTPVNQVNQVNVTKASTAGKATLPSYRFERHDGGVYNSGSNLQSNTIASTVAHTAPVIPSTGIDTAWLSPWWMLICLIPLALYFATRRAAATDQHGYGYDTVGDHPELPSEIIERPGYSKSDAIYGESDEFFMTERLYARPRQQPVAGVLPLATPIEETKQAHRPQSASSPSERSTETSAPAVEKNKPTSRPVIRFAKVNSVQIRTELKQESSPNFRASPTNTVVSEVSAPKIVTSKSNKKNRSKKKRRR